MLDIWLQNIKTNLDLVESNSGPSLVTVVSGSPEDSIFWKDHFLSVKKDVFRSDGLTNVVSVCESVRKGNFLGMLNAWAQTIEEAKRNDWAIPEVGLMSMVFGKGTRLSPFTQAMGSRKPAFVTPRKAKSGSIYLTAADLSNLFTNSWIEHFGDGGFRGLIMKWGDEALIPGTIWEDHLDQYLNADAIRIIWRTEINETLAMNKEWIEVDEDTGLMTYQYPRQKEYFLRERVSKLEKGKTYVGVNLGSFAISYKFLDIALNIFKQEVNDSSIWIDWDPYVWIALFCTDKKEWEEEKQIEKASGLSGIIQLESKVPDFFSKITLLRQQLEHETGHSFSVPVIDFANMLYVDMGLHWPLRDLLNSMTTESDMGRATRKIFGISDSRDEKGNIIINSRIPSSCVIKNSVIIDTIILDGESVIKNGVVIGGKHRKLIMPDGGIALFCAVDYLEFQNEKGLAYRSIGKHIVVPSGGRHTTLIINEGLVDLVSNESVLEYKGPSYDEPIFGNKYSFDEAYNLMSRVDSRELERTWHKIWKNWLD